MRLALFVAGVLLAAPAPVVVAQQRAELVERTLAIVAGQAITLSDVRTARALRLVEGADDAAVTERLVDRALMLREVERYAPLEPDPAVMERRKADIESRLPATELERVLAAGGFTDARLRAWVRDDLRIEAYLNGRFAAEGAGGQTREDLIADWIADLRRRTPVVELWRKSAGSTR